MTGATKVRKQQQQRIHVGEEGKGHSETGEWALRAHRLIGSGNETKEKIKDRKEIR